MKRGLALLALMMVAPTADAAPRQPTPAPHVVSATQADGSLYLIRSREPLPRMPGLVEVSRDGCRSFVTVDADAATRLLFMGHTLYPVPSSPAPPRMPARTWTSISTPDPEVQALVDQVSWDGISAKILKLQRFGTRFALTPTVLQAADTLAAFFQNLGLSVEFQDVEHSYQVQRNVVATQVGTTYPDQIFVICGHYDSLSEIPWTSAPGADDNASGVAAVMMAAELFSHRWFEYTIKYIAFAGEELGKYGSDGYTAWAAGQGLDIVGALNFDMIGYWYEGLDYDLEIESNQASVWLMNAITNAADLYTTMPYETHVYDAATWGDHYSFWMQGYSAVNHEEAWDYTDPDFNPHYHTSRDRMDLLWPDFATGSVRIAVAALATLARPDLSITSVPDRGLGSRALLSASPNPFRDGVVLDLSLPGGANRARIGIFDPQGRLLEVLTVPLHDGRGSLRWDPGRSGSHLPASVLFARVLDGGGSETVKLIHLE
jgi:hypothetical protein